MRRLAIPLLLLLTAPAVAQRPVYPFSITPGGIYSQQDWDANKAEPVYALVPELKDSQVRPAQLRVPIEKYISFRKDGQVWWTAEKHLVKAGEYVMVATIENQEYTRIDIAVRGRCGNLLSDVPPPAVSRSTFVPPDTPEKRTVEIPLPPDMGSLLTPPGFPFSTPEELTPEFPQTASTRSQPCPTCTCPPAPASTPSTSPVPFPAFIPGGWFYPVTGSSAMEIAGAAAVAAPEPSTWILLTAGLVLIALRSAITKRGNN